MGRWKKVLHGIDHNSTMRSRLLGSFLGLALFSILSVLLLGRTLGDAELSREATRLQRSAQHTEELKHALAEVAVPLRSYVITGSPAQRESWLLKFPALETA